MTIDELNARQDEIRSELVSLDQENAGQELAPEARDKWDRLEEEFDANGKKLTELEFRRSRVEALAGKEENRESTTPEFQTARPGSTRGEDIWDLSTIRSSISGPEEATRELRDRALRALERAEFAHEHADRDATRTHIERLISKRDGKHGAVSQRIMLTGNPTYERAFSKAISGSQLTPEESRAMSLTAENGGFAVPYTLDPTFNLTSSGVVNPIRQLADVKPITTNEWKGVNTAGVTASYDGEATEASDDAPTLSQPTVVAHRATVFVPFSYEYDQDFGGLQAELAKLTQDAKDTKEASAFLTGTGEGQPYGILTGVTGESEVKSTATKEAFAVADLYTVKGGLPPRYVPNATWLANDAIYDRIRQFDTEGGANLWVRLKEGRPPELIGKPARELSTMATEVGSKEAKILLYGDFKQYVIAERLGMGVKLIPDLFGENGRPTGQSGFYAFWRNGGKVRNSGAFQVLKVKKE